MSVHTFCKLSMNCLSEINALKHYIFRQIYFSLIDIFQHQELLCLREVYKLRGIPGALVTHPDILYKSQM